MNVGSSVQNSDRRALRVTLPEEAVLVQSHVLHPQEVSCSLGDALALRPGPDAIVKPPQVEGLEIFWEVLAIPDGADIYRLHGAQRPLHFLHCFFGARGVPHMLRLWCLLQYHVIPLAVWQPTGLDMSVLLRPLGPGLAEARQKVLNLRDYAS